MIKSIELTFNGNFSDGFNVFLVIQAHDSKGRIPIHRLEPEPKIPELYKNWKKSYVALDRTRTIAAIPDQVTNISIEECKTQARELSDCFRTWLGSRNFGKIRERIISHIAGATEVRVFLASDDKLLQRLPWHLLDLFDHPHIEVSLIPLDYSKSNLVRPPSNNNILAVFGADQGINLKGDLETMLKLSNSNPPVFSIKPEVKPLQKQLGERQWDILFFSGHSGTRLNGGVNEGVICINETEHPLTIENLKTVLQDAISKGLKLAIFNSCDGIYLAEALLELKIPQVVVMREPVANDVAEEFLKHFLKAFSDGASLDLAVRHARRKLQSEEIKYPCASWLPMIYQNPAEDSLIWKKAPDTPLASSVPINISASTIKTSRNISFKNVKKTIWYPVIFGILALFLVILLQPKFLPTPINLGDRISDGNRVLIPYKDKGEKDKFPKEKLEGVTALKEKNFNKAISKFESSIGRQSNDPETWIYLNNAKIGNKDSLKIAVSVPIGKNLNVAQEILRGVAQAQDEYNKIVLDGKSLKVVIANDDNDEKTALAIAEKFADDQDILAVVGHNSSKASLAAAPAYQKAKLVVISSTSNATNFDDLSNYQYKYYRTLPSIRRDVSALVDYANKKGWKQIAICSEDDPSSESFKQEFTRQFSQKGGSIYKNKRYEDKFCYFPSKDFNADEIISELSGKVDGLLLLPNIDNIIKAIEIAKANMKWKIPLVGSAAMYTNETLQSGKESVKDMVIPTIWHPDFDSIDKDFISKANSKWGTINWRTATSYDAMQVIIAGLSQNPNPNRDDLREFIPSSKFNILSLPGIKNEKGNKQIIFNQSGDRDAKIRLVQIQSTGADSYKFRPLSE